MNSRIDVDISPKHCSRCVCLRRLAFSIRAVALLDHAHTHCVAYYAEALSLSLSPACVPGAYQNYLVCISNGQQRNISLVHMSCSAGGAFVCGIYSRSTLSPSLFVRFDLQFTNTTASIAACPFGCHSRHPQFLFACHADVQRVPRHDSTREFRHRARFYLHPTRYTYIYSYTHRPDK